MPRTGPNGEYTLPPNTDNQQPNTTIRSSMFNGAMGDVAQAFNTAWPTSLLPQIPNDKGGYRWNWVINGDFIINQRGGPKKPANGVYGYDRWKGHSNGIEQPVEALSAGEYTLTWEGGGTGTFGGVTGNSPIKSTVSSGNHSVIVPETATRVSLVNGDATTVSDPFSPRNIQQEMLLCQRYYRLAGWGAPGMVVGGSAAQLALSLSPPMRSSPSVSLLDTTPTLLINGLDATGAGATIGFSEMSPEGIRIEISGFSGLTVGSTVLAHAGANGKLFSLDAEI